MSSCNFIRLVAEQEHHYFDASFHVKLVLPYLDGRKEGTSPKSLFEIIDFHIQRYCKICFMLAESRSICSVIVFCSKYIRIILILIRSRIKCAIVDEFYYIGYSTIYESTFIFSVTLAYNLCYYVADTQARKIRHIILVEAIFYRVLHADLL